MKPAANALSGTAQTLYKVTEGIRLPGYLGAFGGEILSIVNYQEKLVVCTSKAVFKLDGQ